MLAVIILTKNPAIAFFPLDRTRVDSVLSQFGLDATEEAVGSLLQRSLQSVAQSVRDHGVFLFCDECVIRTSSFFNAITGSGLALSWPTPMRSTTPRTHCAR